ncbi:MAG: hypothetical protein ACR2LM_04110, partial [Pyrinomonadaceae bacterium]
MFRRLRNRFLANEKSLSRQNSNERIHDRVRFLDLLHGTAVAMYIVGQERRLVNPPSQVVAGVRTVTTKMDGRDALPRMSRP